MCQKTLCTRIPLDKWVEISAFPRQTLSHGVSIYSVLLFSAGEWWDSYMLCDIHVFHSYNSAICVRKPRCTRIPLDNWVEISAFPRQTLSHGVSIYSVLLFSAGGSDGIHMCCVIFMCFIRILLQYVSENPVVREFRWITELEIG